MPSLRTYRIEIESSLQTEAARLHQQLHSIGLNSITAPRVSTLYFLQGEVNLAQINLLAETLIIDPVTDSHTVHELSDRVENFNHGQEQYSIVEVAYRPGVTDNVSQELLDAADRMGISGLHGAASGIRYKFDQAQDKTQIESIAKRLLVNDTIQRFSLSEIFPEFISQSPSPAQRIEECPVMNADSESLATLSADRRLALDGKEMAVIQDYFQRIKRNPTDAELETLAQTWSEHCVHKTFKGTITSDSGEVVNGIIYQYLKAATDTIDAPWVRSAFVDNAGVIEFDDHFDISFKVETHNHPSAIEPFGGANTGVGGVVRDILGVSHRPIANTDVLCFGPQDCDFDDLPAGVIHPRRIQEGVIHGVGDYGNKLGIPTINGAILYHHGFTANPLVYCGCIGIGPVGAHPSQPNPGDRIILIGGKTGRDGLRGATFSSLTMDAQTGEIAGAAVQIGDPITEKGLLEVVEIARDQSLYNAITDCGAGGLSSAVGEMSSNLGAIVDLALVPTKYAGLAPWEIWLSEAQERMVLAVPLENVDALGDICRRYWVELSDIGVFEESGNLVVRFANKTVVDLENDFLHNGIPVKQLNARSTRQKTKYQPPVLSAELDDLDFNPILLALLSHPNIASKENTIRQYDHEVRGATVIKPFAGVSQHGPSDAAVIKPLNTAEWRGFAVANGINPYIGETAPYYMALNAVDEAIRNLVAVGADPSRIALLDNFCWGSPDRPEILGSLVEAARGCHDASIFFNAPFISGKDSLNNEFLAADGSRQAIPGTLLISSIGIVPDIRFTATMDLKAAGDHIYLVGEWLPTFTGSHITLLDNHTWSGIPQNAPPPNLSRQSPIVYASLFSSVRSGLVSAMHDLSEGGLLTALAEMCLAGGLGAQVDLEKICTSAFTACFAETAGCLLVAVPQEKKPEFETAFSGLPIQRIGMVSTEPYLQVSHGNKNLLDLPVGTLEQAFMGINKDQNHA